MSDFSRAIRYFIYGAVIAIAIVLINIESVQGASNVEIDSKLSSSIMECSNVHFNKD